MGDYQVGQLGEEFLGCRLANEKPNVIERVGGPRDKDQESDQDGTDGVDVPDDTASHDRHGKTESVDNDIVAVVNEKDMY